MKHPSCDQLRGLATSRYLWLCFIFTAVIGVQGKAQTNNTWDRGANTNYWNDALNWSLNTVPTNEHDVILPDNAIVTVNTQAICHSLVINAGIQSTSLTIGSNQRLTVSNQVIINGSTVPNKPKGIIIGDELFSCGSLTMGNPFDYSSHCYLSIDTGTAWVNGDLIMTGNSKNENQVNFTGAGILNIIGSMSSSGTLLPNNGTVNYMGIDQTVGAYTYHHLNLCGSGTKTLTAPLIANGNFTIHEGVLLNTNNHKLTLGGDFTIGRTIDFGASPVALAGTATQSVDGFTTTGMVFMSKAYGKATFTGNVQGAELSMVGTSGTLHLGWNLTHTFTGAWLRNSGTLEGGSSILRLGDGIGGSSIGAFQPQTGTVDYFGPPLAIASLTYYNLILSGPGMKSITPQSQVTVNGSLETNGLLTIDSNATHSGSLIVNGTSVGSLTYNRWMDHFNTNPSVGTPGFSRWYITSAPVMATGFNNAENTGKIHIDASASPQLYDFATYHTPGNQWNYVATLPPVLTPGQGYLMSLVPESDGIISFTGQINTDLSAVPIQNNGWNALGNPFTSAMGAASTIQSSVKNFLTENSGILESNYSAIYVWNEPTVSGTTLYNETQQYYRIIGNAGYSPIPTDMSVLGDKSIQTGQGFLINVKANPTAQFAKFFKGTNGMQYHKTDLSLKSAAVSWPGITLLAESHGKTRSTVVTFNDLMTTGLDVTYDAGLLPTDPFQVYTNLIEGVNTVDFAIQCLPDNQYRELSVPLGVDLHDGGEVEFKVTGVVLPQGLYPVIEDKLLVIKTALKTETDTYTVVLDKNTRTTGRFYLSVEGIGLGTTEMPAERKFTVSFKNNRMVVWGIVEPGTKALLFDTSGRKVGEFPLANTTQNEIVVPNVNQRFYILKIEGRNWQQTLKLFVGL